MGIREISHLTFIYPNSYDENHHHRIERPHGPDAGFLREKFSRTGNRRRKLTRTMTWAAVIDQGDVVIDFSAHSATPSVAALCAKHQKAMVIGTTGHTDADKFEVTKVMSKIPVVWASNFSTGVNTLFWLTRKAAEILGPDFDLEVVEMHHRLKRDAPSGTAKTLAEILAAARHCNLDNAARHGRDGIVGERNSAKSAFTRSAAATSSATTRSFSRTPASGWN